MNTISDGIDVGFQEDGHLMLTSHDRDGEAMIQRCCADNGINERQAVCFIEWAYENLPNRSGESSGDEMRRQFLFWLADLLSVLIAYQDRQRDDARLVRMSSRAMALALGFTHVAGAKDATDLARKLGLERLFGQKGKATTGKCVNMFINKLKLSPLPGQRNDKARANMAAARKRQIKQ